MKRPVLAALIAATSFCAQSQDNLTNIGDLDGLDFVPLGRAGLVIKGYEDKKTSIRYYTPEAGVVWQAEAPREYSSKGNGFLLNLNDTQYDLSENFIVAAPSGSWVYNVEMKPDELYKKNQYITQINKTGSVKRYTIEGREELGRNLQTVFCDDNYFYILSTDNGDEQHKNKKSEEKLILNRYDAKTFTYKRIILDLPAVEPGLTTTFWKFLGQTAREMVLVSKNIDYENEKGVFTIATFDSEGKVVKTFKIEPKLEGTFFRPAFAPKMDIAGFHQSAEFDHFLKRPQGSTYALIEPTNGGFSNITFDPVSESFYVFGLAGPTEYRARSPIFDGFYIYKYNKQGEAQWRLQAPASQELMEEKYFRVGAQPGYRNISLKVFPDNSLNFSIHFKATIFTHAVSADGKLTRTSRKDEHPFPTDNLILPAGAPLKSESYLKKFDLKKKGGPVFTNLAIPQGEVLLESGGGSDKLLYFKN